MSLHNQMPPKVLPEKRSPLVRSDVFVRCSSFDHRLDAPSPANPSQSDSQTSNPPRSPTSRKLPARKIGAQPTRLETVDGSHDPLGPLGVEEPALPSASSSLEQAPAPPRKESSQTRNTRLSGGAQQASSSRSAAEAAERDDSSSLPKRTRGPPPVQPAAVGSLRQTQPSVSIEQAAKPSFDITVGDPHKVGDITSSHIVYQVRTKVRRIAIMTRDSQLTGLRLRRKHTVNQTSLFRAGIATFYGFTTLCTTTTLALWYRLHQKSRLLVDLIPISSNRDGKR